MVLRPTERWWRWTWRRLLAKTDPEFLFAIWLSGNCAALGGCSSGSLSQVRAQAMQINFFAKKHQFRVVIDMQYPTCSKSGARAAKRASTATACWLAMVAPILLCGCHHLKPARAPRCGIPELCDPAVRCDPFPDDMCVPPKSVDPGHFGYVRPQWRVLGDRASLCCTPSDAGGADTTFELKDNRLLPAPPDLSAVPSPESYYLGELPTVTNRDLTVDVGGLPMQEPPFVNPPASSF